MRTVIKVGDQNEIIVYGDFSIQAIGESSMGNPCVLLASGGAERVIAGFETFEEAQSFARSIVPDRGRPRPMGGDYSRDEERTIRI